MVPSSITKPSTDIDCPILTLFTAAAPVSLFHYLHVTRLVCKQLTSLPRVIQVAWCGDVTKQVLSHGDFLTDFSTTVSSGEAYTPGTPATPVTPNTHTKELTPQPPDIANPSGDKGAAPLSKSRLDLPDKLLLGSNTFKPDLYKYVNHIRSMADIGGLSSADLSQIMAILVRGPSLLKPPDLQPNTLTSTDSQAGVWKSRSDLFDNTHSTPPPMASKDVATTTATPPMLTMFANDEPSNTATALQRGGTRDSAGFDGSTRLDTDKIQVFGKVPAPSLGFYENGRGLRRSTKTRSGGSTTNSSPTRSTVADVELEVSSPDSHVSNLPPAKQDMLSEPEMRLQLTRLNLDVLQRLAEMLGQERQKLSAESDMLGASRDMLRAETLKSVAERGKIEMEREKLDLERDLLQSQMLGRRRSIKSGTFAQEMAQLPSWGTADVHRD
uniref:Uncharacterized protein n=1 Tax=Timema bartmani TaxID=61472 RepID=A0A7R9HWQ3_9NEOP|nr:unnamed protein product [Timema bartmani]